MEMINIIVDTFGILALLAGIGLGLKKFYEFLRTYIKKRRAVIPKKELDKFNHHLSMQRVNSKLDDLGTKVDNLEKRIPSTRKVNSKVRLEVRNYLKELQK